MVEHYRSQNGKITPLADMHADHLERAIAKLLRSRDNPSLLQALQDERKRRATK